MDFESLTRRDLQALCKRNKIPANITNVAMIEALKALDIIEGIEELANSSTESPQKLEAASPCIPPTGGRTTRRRNVAKEPETLPQLTRTIRSTRKTVAKVTGESKADGTETPAMPTTRRRAPAASACRKMESDLEECVEDEKKEVSATPAPSGVTSRRRRGVKEESVAKPVYSTRRSTRLAEKAEEVLPEVENVSESCKMELFNKDGDEKPQMNLEESSVTTDVNANKNVEDKEGVDESEVIIDDEMVNNFDTSDQKPEEVMGDLRIEESDFGFETETKQDDSDKPEVANSENLVMPLDVSSEVQESHGSDDVYASEIEIAVEKTENVNMDTPLENEVSEIEKRIDNDDDMDSEDVLDMNINENVQDISADQHIAVEENELVDNTQDEDDSAVNMPSDVSLMNEEEEAKVQPDLSNFSAPPVDLTRETVKATSFTPIKSSATKNTAIFVSTDNKENFGSMSKLALTQEKVKTKNISENASKLHDLSLGQLTKMLKEKLEISKRVPKNENENEIEHGAAPVRQALQALPENCARN